MSLKHGLLGLLSSEGPTTGYDLDKLFKNSLAYFWHAKTSQIYRELSAMEESGWLTSERVLQEEKPNKRVYSVTAEGRDELLKWLMAPGMPIGGGGKSPFLMRIFFAGEAGEAGKEKTLRMIREYREMCVAYGAKLEEVRKELAEDEAGGQYADHIRYWRLTVLHGEISIEAAIEWADTAITILEEEEE